MRRLFFILIFFPLFLFGNNLEKLPFSGFWSKRPASVWEESLVSGNGNMGVMVRGNVYDETLIVNHSKLYLPLHAPRNPVTQGGNLNLVRDLMFNGGYGAASLFITELAKKEGYVGKLWTDAFNPAFSVNIESDSLGIEDYKRIVNFETGEAIVKWKNKLGNFSRETFVSRPDSVIVVHIKSSRKGNISCKISLDRICHYNKGWKNNFMLSENLGYKVIDIESRKNNTLIYKALYENDFNKDNLGFEGLLKVVNKGGKTFIKDNLLFVNGVDELIIYVSVRPIDSKSSSNINSMLNHIDKLSSNYDSLLKRHKKIHSDLFNRVSLNFDLPLNEQTLSSEELLQKDDISPALVKKLFDSSRYVIISSTGDNPPNLQGIWSGTVTPFWSGDYTVNGNLPMAISHYLQSNTPELMLPLFNYLESHIDEFQLNAKMLFNCRGIHVPSRMSTHGLNNHFDATWPMTFWTAGAAWMASFYYDYYLYTGDKKFLKDRALPFMEQAAMFYEDFLIEGEDGKYIFIPSYSPENNPQNSQYQACINATMDVMAANALFNNLISASELLNVNKDKLLKWRNMLSKIPKYQLNEDGELREWMWSDLQDNHNHRHASHLLGLYDLRDKQIMNSSELMKGCENVIQKRLDFRRKENGGIMAFGLVQLGFSACTLGNVKLSSEILAWLSKSYWNNNLVSTHNPHSVFNVDLCGGYPSFIMKMLAYSEPGYIELLPCLPLTLNKGSIKGMALRGGIIINMEWNEEEVKVELLSKESQRIRIGIRNEDIYKVDLKANKLFRMSIKRNIRSSLLN